ncbi:40199_t:CDS:1, partial [Gigaspora margarita]
ASMYKNIVALALAKVQGIIKKFVATWTLSISARYNANGVWYNAIYTWHVYLNIYISILLVISLKIASSQ